MRQSPAKAARIAHNAQWSRCVAAGAASLHSLAYWASASLHPALLSLGSAHTHFYPDERISHGTTTSNGTDAAAQPGGGKKRAWRHADFARSGGACVRGAQARGFLPACTPGHLCRHASALQPRQCGGQRHPHRCAGARGQAQCRGQRQLHYGAVAVCAERCKRFALHPHRGGPQRHAPADPRGHGHRSGRADGRAPRRRHAGRCGAAHLQHFDEKIRGYACAHRKDSDGHLLPHRRADGAQREALRHHDGLYGSRQAHLRPSAQRPHHRGGAAFHGQNGLCAQRCAERRAQRCNDLHLQPGNVPRTACAAYALRKRRR